MIRQPFLKPGFELECGTEPWLLSVVYGSPNASLRNFVWQDLASNSVDLSDPWLAVRDFHSVPSSSSRIPLAGRTVLGKPMSFFIKEDSSLPIHSLSVA